MKGIPYEHSSGNVFADVGFTPAAAAELTVKSMLIMTIGDTIKERSAPHAAGSGAALWHRSTHTFQSPSRAHGKCDHDKLTAWLNALGARWKSAFAPMTVRP